MRSTKGSGTTEHPRTGDVLAAALLAGTLIAAAAPAAAQSQTDILQRIESAFRLIPNTPVASAEPIVRRAMERRAEIDRRAVAALAYYESPMTFRNDPAGGAIAEGLAGTVIQMARLPRPRPEAPEIAESVVHAATAAPETDYFSRFAGSFAGSGEVKRNAEARGNQVKCTLTGQPTESGVSIGGECGAFVFSREVRADIRYDAASGTYAGTYVGSAIGPAQLWGKRRGDEVVLTITWPKPVNGDTKATMTIRNTGNGELAIIVTDKVRPGGPQAEVTRLALSQI